MDPSRCQVNNGEVTLAIVREPTDLVALLHGLKEVVTDLNRAPILIRKGLRASDGLEGRIPDFFHIEALVIR